jgi:MFS family permease
MEPLYSHLPVDDQVSEPRRPVVSLRRNRNFRLLWTGQVLSDLGSQIGALAYTLLVFALTKSAVVAGAVGTIGSVSAFAVRLPAGALADRYDHRRSMVVCDLVRALVLAALAIGIVTHVVTWPVVLVVAVIDRVGDTFFTPASVAALPGVVDDSQLESAWAATEARQYAANLSGPSLGGILYAIGRAVPFVGDAISYGISVLTSSAMKGDFAPPRSTAPRRGLWAEAFEGVRVMLHDDLLRAVIIQAPLINLGFTGVLYTVILGLRHHGVSSSVIGFTESGILVGGLLGAIVAPRIQGRFTLHTLVVSMTGIGAVMVAIAAVLMPSPLIAIPIAIPFFLSPTANAALIAVMLRRAPEEMRGRVNNALLQAATGLATLAPLLSGLLVEHASANWAMGAFAAVLCVSAILALSLKSLRAAEASGGATGEEAEATGEVK